MSYPIVEMEFTILRFTKVLLSIGLILLPAIALSIGLADIKVLSALNQPFKAEVPVIDFGNVPTNAIQVRLATPEEFKRVGVEREPYLSSFDFVVVDTKKKHPIVKIISTEPMDEPVVTFLMEVDAPDGQLLRQYTVFLDPPDYKRTKIVVPASIEPSLQKKRHIPPPSFAPQHKPRALSSQPRQPAAVATKKKHYQQVVQPAKSQQPVHLAKAKTRSQARQPVAAKPAVERVAEKPQIAEKTYITATRFDTLWHIAAAYSARHGISTQQTMAAIFKSNPRAFSQNNINGLMEGYRLKMPSMGEVNAMSYQQALHFLAEKNHKLKHRPAPHAKQVHAQQQSQPKAASSESIDFPNVIETSIAKIVERKMADLNAELGEITVQQSQSTKKLKRVTYDTVSTSALESTQQQIADEHQMGAQSQIIKTLQAELAVSVETLAAMKDAYQELQQKMVLMAGENQQIQKKMIERDQDLATLEKLLARQQDSLQSKTNKSEGINKRQVVSEGQQIQTKGQLVEELQIGSQGGELPITHSDSLWYRFGLMIAFVVLMLISAGVYWQLKRYRLEEENEDEVGDEDVLTASYAEPTKEASQQEQTNTKAGMSEKSGVESELIEFSEEIEVLIAYGRYDQAEVILEKTINQQPGNLDLRIKLLEVAALKKDKQGFAKQLGELPSDISQRFPALWEKILQMKSQAWPSEDVAPMELTTKLETEADQQTIEAENMVEFDTDIKVEERVISGSEKSHADEAENLVEFDLEKTDSSETEQSVGEEDQQSDSEVFEQENHLATQLDLARVYRDMGDLDEATVMLNEVLAGDDESLKQQAQQLLDEIEQTKG